jgi:hypothetical protein
VAAEEALAEHVVREHATEVDADVPEGMVQVRVGDGEWRTMTPAAARAYHESLHADERPSGRD